jgi:hypothetical protein
MLFNNVTITKELAAELLLLNTANRPLRKEKLRQYKDDLISGEWKFAADVLKISHQGVLLDGQHKLLAIVQTGISMTLHIQVGLDPEVFTVLDTGAIRNSGDVVALAGYKYYGTITGVAKLITAFKNGHSVVSATSGFRSNKFVLTLVKALDKDLLEEACHQGATARSKARFLDSILCGALWYTIAERGYKTEITEFLYLLSTGDGLGVATKSSVYLLRNKLIFNLTSPAKLTKSAIFYLMGTCFNSYVKSKVMLKLPSIKEDLPTLI